MSILNAFNYKLWINFIDLLFRNIRRIKNTNQTFYEY